MRELRLVIQRGEGGSLLSGTEVCTVRRRLFLPKRQSQIAQQVMNAQKLHQGSPVRIGRLSRQHGVPETLVPVAGQLHERCLVEEMRRRVET